MVTIKFTVVNLASRITSEESGVLYRPIQNILKSQWKFQKSCHFCVHVGLLSGVYLSISLILSTDYWRYIGTQSRTQH